MMNVCLQNVIYMYFKWCENRNHENGKRVSVILKLCKLFLETGKFDLHWLKEKTGAMNINNQSVNYNEA